MFSNNSQRSLELQAVINSFEYGIAIFDESLFVKSLNLSMLAMAEQNHSAFLIDKKCYQVIYGFDEPCQFCPLKNKNGKLDINFLQEPSFSKEQEIVLYQKNELVGKKTFFHNVYLGMSKESSFIVEILKDITQEKKLEEENLRNEKLVALGTIVQTVAHELQNPLTGMRFTLQSLLQSEVAEDTKKKLLLLEKDLNLVSSIVTDIQGVHRSETYYLEPLVAKSIVTDSYQQIIRSNTTSHKLLFNWECDKNLQILGNERRLQQIFTNLFSNALEAFQNLDEKDKKRASLWIIGRVDEEAEKNKLIIQVIDNGGGIGSGELRRVFDPYFTTKKLKLKMGLGLYFVNRTVEEHGGKIEVDSKGIFTRFLLKFPLQENDIDRRYSGSLYDRFEKH